MSTERAIAAWVEVKHALRRRMSAEEWDLAVREIRLLRLMGNGTVMLLALPRNGMKIFKFEGRRRLITGMLNARGLSVIFTTYPDEWQIEEIRDRFGVDVSRFLDPDPAPARLPALMREKKALNARIRQLRKPAEPVLTLPPQPLIYRLQSLMPQFDSFAVHSLWNACRAKVADCNSDEIFHFVEERMPALTELDAEGNPRVRNPIGFLVKVVPKYFNARAVRELRMRGKQEVACR